MASLVLVYSRAPEESYDVQEIAAEIRDLLEEYQRSPWTGISRDAQGEKLAEATRLLARLEGLHSGAIPMRIWGD